MIGVLLPATLLMVVLLIIHSYFGIQIIKRNIIFTDLAVGQMAALGVAISLYIFEGSNTYYLSVLFAILSASLIALMQYKNDAYQEAFIGLLYAFGISGVFIVMSRSPHGLEELNNLLAYDILFTNYKDIIYVAILYSFIGVFLFLGRNLEGIKRELLFFILFALTITSSVKVAGVFVVFSILIAPSLIAIRLFSEYQVLFAAVIGSMIGFISILISYSFDFPTGYTIVFLNSFLAILTTIITIFLKR